MASGRTDVLIRGAGTTAAVPQPSLVRGSVSVPTPTILATNGARFPGDPGTLIYHGLNNTTTATYNSVQTAVGRSFKLRRNYNGTNWGFNLTAMDEDIAAGRIPVMSWKLNPYTVTTVPDSAIDTMIAQAQARAPHTIWTCGPFHEPENDFTTRTDADNYRALWRRIVLRFRAAGVTNVAWISPFFMDPYTFTSSSGRDWRWWHPDWNGGTTNTSADFYTGTNAVCDMDGFDIYVPLIGSSNWQAPSVSYNTAKTKMASNGYTLKPVVIGELGVRSYLDSTGALIDSTRGPNNMQDGFDKAKADNWVGICWWNTGGDSFLHGPVPASDPGGYREAKLASIVADARSG